MSTRNLMGLTTTKKPRPFSRYGALRFKVRQRGQAIVETGFVIVILLVVSLGLVQYGMIYNGALTLNNLTREGARYASVHSLTVPDDSNLKTQVVAYLRTRANNTTINQNAINSASVIVERPVNEAGREIRVRVNYNLTTKSFAPNLFPLPARYTSYQATASNLIEN